MVIANFEQFNLLNTKFHKLRVWDLINYIIESGKVEEKTVLGHLNVRAMNFSYELPWYQDFFNKADLVYCDGFGVLLGAKLLGYSVKTENRMTGPDFIEDLILACENQNISIFLLAGKPGVVDKAIEKFHAIAPNLRIEGHHGYFEKSGAENHAVIQKINNFKPGLLYVGFGMPIQERWILDNLNSIEAKVFLPMGACLDFYTDTVHRGPRWMTNRGLEWLTRLLIEPQRLWERYIIGNPLFFLRVFKQRVFQGMATKV